MSSLQPRHFDSTELSKKVYLEHKFKPISRTFGASSNVRIYCRSDNDKVKVVIKTMRYSIDDDVVNAKADRALEKDITQLKLCQHPNILEYLGLIEDWHDGVFNGVGIVCTYAENKSLSAFLLKNPDADRYKILREVAAGLLYLHAPSPEIFVDGKKITIVHGDIHPGNVLITGDPERKAVLADFGLSKRAQEGMVVSVTSRTNGADGVQLYLAPEVHRLGNLSKADASVLKPLLDKEPKYAGLRTDKADVFAFGMLMFTTLGGNPEPMLGVELAVTPAIIEGTRPRREDVHGNRSFQDNTWDLICDCWGPYASKRPTMAEVRSRL